MTVSTQIRTVTYAGDGATVLFPIPFPYLAPSHVLLYRTDPGAPQYQVPAAGYGVTPAGASGTLIYKAAGPLPVGSSILITRNVPYTQGVGLTNQDGYYPDVIEAALDQLVEMGQQLRDEETALDARTAAIEGRVTADEALLGAVGVQANANTAAIQTLAAELATALIGSNVLANPGAVQALLAILFGPMAPVVGAVSVAAALRLLGGNTYVPSSPSMPAANVARSQLVLTGGSPGAPLTQPGAVLTASYVSAWGPGTGPVSQHGAICALAENHASAIGAENVTRGLFAEATDYGGNASTPSPTMNFVEGARFHGIAGPNISYGATYGSVHYANSAPGRPYSYVIGAESQVDNQSGTDAPTHNLFNPLRYSASFVATCGEGAGTWKADAGFITNPFNPVPFQTGFMVGYGSVADTAFANHAFVAKGLDLSQGTYSVAAILLRSNTAISAVDLADPGTIRAVLGLSVAPTAGTAGMALLWNNNGTFLNSTVQVGPTDSAGPGYRALRIGNTG